MIKKLIKDIICTFIPVKKYRITIIDETSFSGSNSYALYKYITEHESEDILKKIELKIFSKTDRSKSFHEKLNDFCYKAGSKVIISTHSMERYNKKQKLVQLWHGIPLKAMGLLDKNYCREWVKNDKKIFDDTDIIISPSELYTTLMNSVLGQEEDKYRLLGYPRNDYLSGTGESSMLVDLFQDLNKENKTIFYVPTFKMGYADRVEGNTRNDNFFGFEECSLKKFSNFLIENKINFILKLHPFEENYYKEKLKELNLKNIYFLSSEMLIKKEKDLYQYLCCSDMLITDYSSVYFDYLITGKPLLFINVDEDEYRKTRGFLLEPYEFWAPGPKVQSQQMLEKEILNLLHDNNYYKAERKQMTEIFHAYIDGRSSQRVWNLIKREYLNLKD